MTDDNVSGVIDEDKADRFFSGMHALEYYKKVNKRRSVPRTIRSLPGPTKSRSGALRRHKASSQATPSPENEGTLSQHVETEHTQVADNIQTAELGQLPEIFTLARKGA